MARGYNTIKQLPSERSMSSSFLGRKRQNSTVGLTLTIARKNIKATRYLSEGAYGCIYEAQEVENPVALYALKQMRATNTNMMTLITTEINVLKSCQPHPNIVAYFGREIVKGNEFYVLMELCRGSLREYFKCSTFHYPLPIETMIKIGGQLCGALSHLHLMQPITIHRDIKMENLLVSRNGTLKLCDFGSCTQCEVNPDPTWTPEMHLEVKEEVERHTTPINRAPEMLETYSFEKIGDKADVWAMGCVLFELLYGIHPFENESKMAIINVQLKRPKNVVVDPNKYKEILTMLDEIFVIRTQKRPYSTQLYEKFHRVARELGVNLAGPFVYKWPLGSGNRPTEVYEATLSTSKDAINSGKELFSKVMTKAGSFINNIISPHSTTTNSSYSNTKQTEFISSPVTLPQTPARNHSRKNLAFQFSSRITIINQSLVDPQLLPKLMENVVKVKTVLLVACMETQPSCFSSIPCQILHHPTKEGRLINLKTYYESMFIVQTILEKDPNSQIFLFQTGKDPCNTFLIIAGIILMSGFCDTPKDALSLVIKRVKFKRIQTLFPPCLASVERYLGYFNYCLAHHDSLPKVRSVHIKYAYILPWKGEKINLDKDHALGINVYCFEILVFSTTNVTVTTSGEVMFYMGITVVGDVRVEVVVTRNQKDDSFLHNFPLFSASFNSSFVPKNADLVEFDGVQLDPYSFKYLDDIASWKFTLELFPGTPLTKHDIFTGPTIIRKGNHTFSWISEPEHISYFSKLNEKQPLEIRNIMGQLAVNQQLQSSEAMTDSTLAGIIDPLTVPIDPNAPIYEQKPSLTNIIEKEKLEQKSPNISQEYNEFNQNAPKIGLLLPIDVPTEETLPKQKTTPFMDSLSSNNNNNSKGGIEFDLLSGADPLNTSPIKPSDNISPLPPHASIVDKKWAGPDLLDMFGDGSSTTQSTQPPSAHLTSYDIFGKVESSYGFENNPNPPLSNQPATNSQILSPLDQLMNDYHNVQNTWTPSAPNVPQYHQYTSGTTYTTPYNLANQPSLNFTPHPFIFDNVNSNNQQSQTPISDATSNSNISSSSPSYLNHNKPNPPNESQSSTPPLPKKDAFENILHNQFENFNFLQGNNNDQQPKSLSELMRRKEENKARDPITHKVNQWAIDKQKNIRQMLAKLQDILWEEAAQSWHPVTLNQLQQGRNVKRAYMKACLLVHPDKNLGSENEKLAGLIFMKIVEAWKIFQNSNSS